MFAVRVVVVLVVALALVAGIIKKRSKGFARKFPYEPATALFSPAERSFLGVLDRAVGRDYRVFGKVRIADVATVKAGLNASARQVALNRVALKHFDFVVCRASDLVVLCAVELNDKSHATTRAQARDELVSNVCKAIGLPLLVVPARQTYPVQEIRVQFFAAIS